MRLKTSKKTVLVYENTKTGRRYDFRKVDSHSYVYTNDEGVRESVGVYRIKKGDWKFIPGASSISRTRPEVSCL
jgi:hypothetical protein